MVRFTMSGRAMSNLLSLREPRDRHDRPVPGVRHLATQVVGGGHQAGEHRREPGPALGRQWQVCQGAQLIDRLSGDEVLWIHGLLSSCGGSTSDPAVLGDDTESILESGPAGEYVDCIGAAEPGPGRVRGAARERSRHATVGTPAALENIAVTSAAPRAGIWPPADLAPAPATPVWRGHEQARSRAGTRRDFISPGEVPGELPPAGDNSPIAEPGVLG